MFGRFFFLYVYISIMFRFFVTMAVQLLFLKGGSWFSKKNKMAEKDLREDFIMGIFTFNWILAALQARPIPIPFEVSWIRKQKTSRTRGLRIFLSCLFPWKIRPFSSLRHLLLPCIKIFHRKIHLLWDVTLLEIKVFSVYTIMTLGNRLSIPYSFYFFSDTFYPNGAFLRINMFDPDRHGWWTDSIICT